ncbi:rod shape-determining protein RodA [Halocella sp. SP3-1]|uniref:rod shape-determining protein RodA n=1 Tax=Halocella sp. SP3-1 TaxID=2382161 RepID=UPI000F75C4A0|nr:rod shape-determining protein RodA [Halocella sp. SP3-1]AZO94314.1 rod shape-determining protein RodA [Halocella sp. SP3-1]
MSWNKKLIKNLNWYIPLTVFLLIIIGIIAISSALELNKTDSMGLIYVQRQVTAAIMGCILVIIIQFFDYRVYRYYADIIYLSTIGILGIILVVGHTVAGGKRWLNFGPINFQPSELAKIMLILVLAAVIDEKKDDLKHIFGFVKPFIYVLVPFVLIILQNDLGTSLVLLAIFIGILFVSGANLKIMLGVFGGGFLSVVAYILSHIYLNVPLFFLKEYQLNRLIIFINPDLDPYGRGYNIIQSKIALGSGKLLGKGLFAGTQSQLEFLPEKHTDFIFSVIGEEFGFLGVIIVILLCFFLLWQILEVASKARDDYGRFIATGVAAMFFFHIIENIGMTMGLMPITGLPLPFVSYGGSSMLTSMIAIGLVINVNLRRKKIIF